MQCTLHSSQRLGPILFDLQQLSGEDSSLPHQDGQVYCLGRNTYGQHADSDSIRFIRGLEAPVMSDADVGIPDIS